LNKRLENAFDVSQNVMIPESYDVISGFLEYLGPRRILHDPFCVLPAIDFDDEFQIQGNKIDDIARDRLLPFELDAIEPPITQLASHHLLGFRHLKPQNTRLFIHGRAPSPNPLPTGERASEPQIPFAVANPCPIHY
jgi:hypothetical protein